MQQMNFSASKLNLAKLSLVIALIGLTVACGKKHEDDKSSQSLVSVNGDEITVHQLNNELQRANIQPAQQQVASRQIVQNLVDRQILVHAAVDEKLDRKPVVMQFIENAKAQILAQAYLENHLSSLAKPTSAEIANYRSEHQDIFANRKIYIADQMLFTLGAAYSDEIKTIVKLKSQKELEQWLTSRGIKFATKRAEFAAETLQPQLLTKFSQMNVGQMVFINSNNPNGNTEAIIMVGIKDAPISEKDSMPIIGKILAQQKRNLAIEAEMKRLRSAAKVVYINKEYDPANAPKQSVQQAPVKSGEASQEQTKSKIEGSVSKGLNGL